MNYINIFKQFLAAILIFPCLFFTLVINLSIFDIMDWGLLQQKNPNIYGLFVDKNIGIQVIMGLSCVSGVLLLNSTLLKGKKVN
jgi:hypothetical protein